MKNYLYKINFKAERNFMSAHPPVYLVSNSKEAALNQADKFVSIRPGYKLDKAICLGIQCSNSFFSGNQKDSDK